jgi:serine/threonine protein kinase
MAAIGSGTVKTTWKHSHAINSAGRCSIHAVCPQVWSTAKKPILTPRCRGSGALHVQGLPRGSGAIPEDDDSRRHRIHSPFLVTNDRSTEREAFSRASDSEIDVLSPGTKLGPYDIVAPLDAGGKGAVYEARDTRLDRNVAIKILPEAPAADPQFRERFRQ